MRTASRFRGVHWARVNSRKVGGYESGPQDRESRDTAKCALQEAGHYIYIVVICWRQWQSHFAEVQGGIMALIPTARRVAIVALVSVFIAGSSGRILAQGSAPIFKGAAVERSTPGVKPASGATALSTLDLKKLVGSEPGSVFVTLSPRDPSALNRGALVFVTPTVVEGGENYAIWGKPSSGKPHLYSQTELDKIKKNILDAKLEQGGYPSNPSAQPGPAGWVMLWLRSAASRKYLIDCIVGGSPFVVSGPANAEVFQLNQMTGHLNFVLDAATAGWYSFQIASGNEFGWTFYSCEVKNL